MKKYLFISCIILITIVALLAFNSCSGKKGKNIANTGTASFNWIEYKGNDPVYKELTDTVNQYLNPILAGFYPDPSIVSVGEDFYLVNSSFSFYPGIPIFHSKDLVNWEQIGYVMDRPSQLELDSLGVSRGVFAPDISYHDSTFYVLNTIVDGKGNYYVSSKDPAGPWSDPVWIAIDGIDPSFFFDEDGKVYIMNNGSPEMKPLYEGHRAIWIQEFDLSTQKFIGPRKVIINGGTDLSKKPIWIEGPHIYKVNGTYYLTAAEGGTYEDHSQVVFRSKSVWGPFIPYQNNPILTQRNLDSTRINPITCTGHADFVETNKGEWWAIFLGCRPYEGNCYNTGRETFLLPVKWVDGWPVILQGNETVPYTLAKPNLPQQPKASYPLNGNFTVRDEFNDSALGYQYYFLRTPREKWYEIKDGVLNMKLRPQPIDKLSQPSFVARRQQHVYCSVSTSLSYAPANIGDKAGLVVFQNEVSYYFIGVAKSDSGMVVQLEQGSSSGPVIITKSNITLSESNTIFLKIEARGKYYDFFYSTAPNEWTMLKENIDATLLSTLKAGGFVGACFGMYACSVR
jgi:xylan 1,4-beta-xylosidase